MPIRRKRMFRKKKNYVTRRQVKGIVNSIVETKYIDTQYNASSIDTLFPPRSVSEISQNPEADGRVGNQVTYFNLNYKLIFRKASGVTVDDYNTLRIIVFKWNIDTVNTDPVVGDVLETGIASQNLPFAQYMFDNIRSGKVYIYSDRIYKVDLVSNETVIVKRTIRLKKKQKIRFDADPASTEGYGKLYILTISDSSVAPHPLLTGTVRLLYKDA